MGDGKVISPQPQSFDPRISDFILNVMPQFFYHKNKEKRGDRVPLLKTSRGVEGRRREDIKQNGEHLGGDHSRNLVYPSIVKTKSLQDTI